MAIEKVKKGNRIYWDDADKEAITENVYDALIADITKPLLDIIKHQCANYQPGKNRSVNSLQSVLWLTKSLNNMHTEKRKMIKGRFEELRKFQAKPKFVELTDEERIKNIPTWMLIMELVNRTNNRLSKIEAKIGRTF